MTRATRRGSHVLLFAVALMAVLGFGALALDVGWMFAARAQAQDIADGASQAAMIVLRQTGNTARAAEAAEAVVAANAVAGEAPALLSLTFGTWDDTLADPYFSAGGARPNAVQARVGRVGGGAVPFLLARVFGYDVFDVAATAVSASRSVQVAIVLDITGSWGEADFAQGRAAVLLALDLLAASATDADQLGMTIFTNRYAWAYTPFVQIADPDVAAAVRADWSLLNLASKAGVDADPLDGANCAVHAGALRDNFTNPPGGCYPPMPREYADEPGTDHSTGIALAQALFEETTGGANYRAMIVVTDGRPNALGADSGATREAQGHVEDRWRQYTGDVPRSQAEIRAAAIASTEALWEGLRVHTWVVSLVADDPMMPQMVRGDGSYTRTDDARHLSGILAHIISGLPLAIVQ